jgi:hypothetical protein
MLLFLTYLWQVGGWVAPWWKTVELLVLAQAISLFKCGCSVYFWLLRSLLSWAGHEKLCVPVCFARFHGDLNVHVLGSGNFKHHDTALSPVQLYFSKVISFYITVIYSKILHRGHNELIYVGVQWNYKNIRVERDTAFSYLCSYLEFFYCRIVKKSGEWKEHSYSNQQGFVDFE